MSGREELLAALHQLEEAKENTVSRFRSDVKDWIAQLPLEWRQTKLEDLDISKLAG